MRHESGEDIASAEKSRTWCGKITKRAGCKGQPLRQRAHSLVHRDQFTFFVLVYVLRDHLSATSDSITSAPASSLRGVLTKAYTLAATPSFICHPQDMPIQRAVFRFTHSSPRYYNACLDLFWFRYEQLLTPNIARRYKSIILLIKT